MREAGGDTAKLAEDVETLEIEIIELEGEQEPLDFSACAIQAEIHFCDEMSPGISTKKGGLGKSPSPWLLKVRCAMARHGTARHSTARHCTQRVTTLCQVRDAKSRQKATESALKTNKAQLSTARTAFNLACEQLKERNIGQGPFTKVFDVFFVKHNIQRLKYFGGSLQGNDIHTVFRDGVVIKELAALVASRLVVCGNERVVSLGSDTRAAELERVLLSFGTIHNLYNRKEPLCLHEKAVFPSQVCAFAVNFAEAFPKEKPTPKMHIICHHHVDLMALKGSIGQETEQGMESFHCEVARVQRNLVGVRDHNMKAEVTMKRVRARADAGDLKRKKHDASAVQRHKVKTEHRLNQSH